MEPRPSLSQRASGVLLHPTSLPGGPGVGDLGGAKEIVEFLAAAAQSWWQMLPIGPPRNASPYKALSVFAGDGRLVSLEDLRVRGLLPRTRALRSTRVGARRTTEAPRRADFAQARREREPRLREAFATFRSDAGARERRALERFARANATWLPDYALFQALRREQRGRPWTEWPSDLRKRRPAALAAARRRLADEIAYHELVQWIFDEQWSAVRAHAARRGIALLGDVPIYVDHDSADVWSHPELFWLDRSGRSSQVAGVPPDYFSATGQLWGNPLYRWDALAQTGFRWWIDRLRYALRRFDALRLDHFIGFARYWAIPAGAADARSGRYRRGPRDALFRALFGALGRVELVAEDLGSVTREVIELRDRLGLPGMRVLQFAFLPGEEGSRPWTIPERCVVYPGTHDNDTAAGWFHRRGRTAQRERELVRSYLGTDGREIHWDLIRTALASPANVAIVAAQDLLGLGSESRLNTPGAARGNWAWRLRPGELAGGVARRLRTLTETYGRAKAKVNSARRR
ncbi:MAG: 4-alpha-glucanotransferase [Deltaproteobacteria bacterium]|nr:4-alpha-glucanotransferase [Deltaproteobacteria bacterium]